MSTVLALALLTGAEATDWSGGGVMPLPKMAPFDWQSLTRTDVTATYGKWPARFSWPSQPERLKVVGETSTQFPVYPEFPTIYPTPVTPTAVVTPPAAPVATTTPLKYRPNYDHYKYYRDYRGTNYTPIAPTPRAVSPSETAPSKQDVEVKFTPWQFPIINSSIASSVLEPDYRDHFEVHNLRMYPRPWIWQPSSWPNYHLYR